MERVLMKYKIFSLLFFICVSYELFASAVFLDEKCGLLKDRIAGAFLGGAIGDALGRVTEFTPSVNAIKEKFGSDGVTHFDDSMKIRIPGFLYPVIPYTDDTVMALLVAHCVLEMRRENSDVTGVMDKLAHSFANLFGATRYLIDPLFDLRAHGHTNQAASFRLQRYIGSGIPLKNPFWWYQDVEKSEAHFIEAISKEAGCGSVMRAWPIGIIFADDISLVKELADKQSCLTHRHPMARAASVALAVGISQALLQKSPDEVAHAMIEAAQEYEARELLYKKRSYKITLESTLSSSLIARDLLVTSDMLRYAFAMAKEGKTPEEVLGTHNMVNNFSVSKNYRSKEGFLLGWAADEAVAAALYIFMRHHDDLQKALIEGVNTPGDSDSIASIAGALVGARTGVELLNYCEFDYSLLENLNQIKTLSTAIYKELEESLLKKGLA